MNKTQVNKTTISDIAAISESVIGVIERHRATALAPARAKMAPTFTAAQVAELCDLDRHKFEYKRQHTPLPQGELVNPKRRVFTLEETHQWVRDCRPESLKPEGKEAIVIATGIFKGGATKTTTAASLAHGLSLKGHRVLVIDVDPQGSMTSLMGFDPNTLGDEKTLLSLAAGASENLEMSVQETYWHDLHMIGANPTVSGAQFYLPQRAQAQGLHFWTVLKSGLTDGMMLAYDVIIIDTPPALDYLTINAFYAADILIVPIPPDPLDFVSSSQFWSLFSQLSQELEGVGLKKEYAHINILASRVDAKSQTTPLVRNWLYEAYGSRVLPVEIPRSDAAKTSQAQFGTVYDHTFAQDYPGSYKRARDAYDRLVEIIEMQLVGIWSKE